MQKVGVLTVMICFLFCANNCLAKEQAVDVGNKICPVTGEKIDPKSNFTHAPESHGCEAVELHF